MKHDPRYPTFVPRLDEAEEIPPDLAEDLEYMRLRRDAMRKLGKAFGRPGPPEPSIQDIESDEIEGWTNFENEDEGLFDADL